MGYGISGFVDKQPIRNPWFKGRHLKPQNMKYIYNSIVVISDNAFLITAFNEMITSKGIGLPVSYYCSPVNTDLLNDPNLPVAISAIKVKKDWSQVVSPGAIIFSLHCKQLFPIEMVKSNKCINVHPGYNPYNRGWYPHIFSLLDKNPTGVTIHEIDEQLDHGAIICRRKVDMAAWETSLDIYNNIQQAEKELLNECLEDILMGNYQTSQPEIEGNVNLKADFEALRKIDLEKKVTMQEAIDYLRAMTHGNFNNLYFIDQKTGKKVFVRINLTPTDNN